MHYLERNGKRIYLSLSLTISIFVGFKVGLLVVGYFWDEFGSLNRERECADFVVVDMSFARGVFRIMEAVDGG